MSTNITQINPDRFSVQDYTFSDNNIIPNFNIVSSFEAGVDYIEYFIYNTDNTLLNGGLLLDYTFYNDPNIIENNGYSTVNIDPESTLISNGFDEGNYNVVYNFLKNELNSNSNSTFYIKEISPDRTELRLSSNVIDFSTLPIFFDEFITQLNSEAYFNEFYLNFGDNQLVIGVNALLEGDSLLIKLYEALPPQFDLKQTLWVVTKVSDPVAYNVEIIPNIEFTEEIFELKGPNLNLNVLDQINNSTSYINYNNLTSTNYSTGSRNLKYQLNSLLEERGIEINVDYSDYSNFIYLSSALIRLENFYYKLKLIEDYTNNSKLTPTGSASSSYTSESVNLWLNKIDEIITTFDGYEYYLYFESSSTSWPKSNSTYPYVNVSTGSASGSNWFNSQSVVASEYDLENNNNLINSIPQYLRNDSTNEGYEFFIEMLGEMFDNIWIYYKDVTNKWNADNRLNYGISKDLVADVLKDLGLKIYQNNFSSNDLFTALLGITSDGNTFPFPYITGSVPTPSGYEYINTKISASNDVIPLQDIEKSIYKRLYHNLPLLYKKKGTVQGLRDLINIYGISPSILRISEFGDIDKDDTKQYSYERFNYAFKPTIGRSEYFFSDWEINSEWEMLGVSGVNVPSTVVFRFKWEKDQLEEILTPTNKNINLWALTKSSYGGSIQSLLLLNYTGSGYTSSSNYNGSTLNPYYQYGTLDFIPDQGNPSTSASLYLPFFNGDWWSVMLRRDDTSNFTLYVGNTSDANLEFFNSSSIAVNDTSWLDVTNISIFSYPSTDKVLPLYQEVRYYNVPLSESAFKSFILDPHSIEGNGLNSSPDQLLFRAALGSELENNSLVKNYSIHPRTNLDPDGGTIPTGSWERIPSFTSVNSWVEFSASANWVPNTEIVYLNEPLSGIKNRISDGIRIVELEQPSGSVLSQYISIQQNPSISQSLNNNINQIEVSFSPQNEINDDITSQYPNLNLGEYIGDPRVFYDKNTSYSNLNSLRDYYFDKYISNYNIFDYVRLIKFFDNSLFKMIKDFTPAQTSLVSGVTIKQHLLERNKYPTPQIDSSSLENLLITGSINNNNEPIWNFNSTQGGSFVDLSGSFNKTTITLNNGQTYETEVGTPIDDSVGLILTQSFLGQNITPLGLVPFTQSNAQEFFNGELSGSNLVVEDGILNGGNPFLQFPTNTPVYDLSSSILVEITPTGIDGQPTRNDIDIAYQTAITQLYNSNTNQQGKFIAAFVYETYGKYSGSYTVSMSFNNSYKLNSPYGTGDLYFAIEFTPNNIDLAVGSGGVFGNSTLNTPSGYSFFSASYNGTLSNSPFLDRYDDNPNSRTLTLLSSSLVNIETTGSSVLLKSNIPPGKVAFTQSANYSVVNNTVTLHYKSNLKYYFVGIKVNNTDDNGIDYTPLLSQCTSFIMSLTDRSNTPVQIGSYLNGQPTILTVTPINRSSTMFNVGAFGNSIGGGNTYQGATPVYNLYSFLLNLGFDGSTSNTAFLTSSNQNLSLITTPGINVDLTYNDNNAILNNALDVDGAQGFYDLDYSQGSLIPVNYSNIISASLGLSFATLAPIQDYNWNVRRSIIPRYSGSKLTSQTYNEYTVGDVSYGKEPVINYNDNVVFLIDFIQGSYPEMVNGTIINIKEIGVINDNSNIVSIDQNTPSTFNFIIDQYLGYSQSSEIYSNDTSNIIGNDLITLDGTIGWPAQSVYFIPRQQAINQSNGIWWTGSVGWSGASMPAGFSGSGGIVFTNSSSLIFPQTFDINGQYITSSISGNLNLSLYSVISASNVISSSLSKGDDWYITLYSGSPYPLQTYDNFCESPGMAPYNQGSVYNYSSELSLASQGIYKILFFGIVGGSTPPAVYGTGSPYVMYLDRPLPDNFKGIGSGSLSGPDSSLSMLIWKSNKVPQSIVIKNRKTDFPSGIGQKGGYVIPKGFNPNFKGVLAALRNNNFTTVLDPKGQLINKIATEISNTQFVATTQQNQLNWVPFNRPGFFNGEIQNLNGRTYTWNGVTWVLNI